MSDEVFAYFTKKFGIPQKAAPLAEERASSLEATMPRGLVDYWRHYGIGLIDHGRFQFCDPEDYYEILEYLFDEDHTLVAGQLHIFGFSAFAELRVWSNEFGTVYVNLLTGEVYGGGLTSEKIVATQKKLGNDRLIFSDLSMIESPTYDGADERGKPLLAPANKRLGELELGECYGFVPALPLGGSAKLENLQRLHALEHFAILAQAQTFRVTDYQTGVRKVVRDIGA